MTVTPAQFPFEPASSPETAAVRCIPGVCAVFRSNSCGFITCTVGISTLCSAIACPPFSSTLLSFFYRQFSFSRYCLAVRFGTKLPPGQILLLQKLLQLHPLQETINR